MTSPDTYGIDEITVELAEELHEGHMKRLGIESTMRLAHAYNSDRYRRQDDWRRALYRDELPVLLAENGPQTCPPIELSDGWVIDQSMSLPHLDRVLEDSEKIIAERSGTRTSCKGAYRSYFQDVWTPQDAERYPAFLDFATSTDVLSTVSRYLGTIPALTTTLPPGVRFVESNALYDDQPGCPRDSQLYHIDYYSLPNVYVLVLLADTTHEHGPWTFIPRSVSQEAKRKLGYWQQGKDYRVSDEELFSVVDRDQVIEFAYPRGTVLFIESSGCFHFGSRDSVKPRFQLMYGYSGVVRTDLSELFMEPNVFPIRESDSRLRKAGVEQEHAAVGLSGYNPASDIRTIKDSTATALTAWAHPPITQGTPGRDRARVCPRPTTTSLSLRKTCGVPSPRGSNGRRG